MKADKISQPVSQFPTSAREKGLQLMAHYKSFLALFLAFCLTTIGLSPMTVHAAEANNDEYTYTIRFYAGTKGKHKDGQEVVIRKDLHYGDYVTFDPRREIELLNNKYYIRGIRESGKDNNTADTSASPSFVVKGDQDYVVTYGVLGDSVACEVHFVDQDGASIAPTETYYGNVGDRPVVAYLYVDGYQPETLAITGTLQRDASKNIFTFVYNKVSEEVMEQVRQVVPATPTPAPTTTTPTPTEPTPPQEDDPGITVPPGEVPRTNPEMGDGRTNAIANETGNTPEEIITNDGEEVPMANPNLDNGLLANDFAKVLLNIPMSGKVGICSIVFLLGGTAGFVLTRKRRKVRYAKSEEGGEE